MKKVLAAILSALLLISSLTACGPKQPASSGDAYASAGNAHASFGNASDGNAGG